MANLSTRTKSPKKPKLVSFVLEIFRVARPLHWIKNFALFAAIVFSGLLLEKSLFTTVVIAFISFSFATSASYILNDILDAKVDRLHPIKRNRPIAARRLGITPAIIIMFISAGISIYIAATLSPLFLLAVLGYLVLQASYSFGLKNIAIIDIFIIAAGFIIRVYAGAFVINAHLSVWFLLCVVSIALFLASGKRRAELGIIDSASGSTRKSLTRYSKPLLDSYVTMFGNAAWMSWALFTFFESPRSSLSVWLFLAELSRTTTVNKLLMITIPVVVFGIMRYESLIFENRSESPEKLFLTDKKLIFSVVLWIILVIWILYGGVTTI